jgi:hypothetical protein
VKFAGQQNHGRGRGQVARQNRGGEPVLMTSDAIAEDVQFHLIHFVHTVTNAAAQSGRDRSSTSLVRSLLQSQVPRRN